MKNKGGKRQGAGRPPAPAELKKRMVSIRLPEWLIQWMDEQPETNRAVLIEGALKKMHGIQPPEQTIDIA
jgi:hypothetical protein